MAPRYDDVIYELAAALDDRSESMAETCRRVGTVAESTGLYRPSYVHLRRFLAGKRRSDDERARRRNELRRIAADIYLDATRGFLIDAYEVASRIQDARLLEARGSEPQAQ